MTVRNRETEERLIEAGRRLAAVLATVAARVAPGVSAEELDALAEKLIRDGSDEPAFLGYTPEGAPRPYPATLCVSINDEIVHGIPNESDKALKEGDIVGLDLGLRHRGIIVDAAVSVPVGKIDNKAQKLLRVTKEALTNGIAAARVGGHVGDISHAIEETFTGTGFSVVKALGGHGVGDFVHEEPFVPNAGRAGEGPELHEGMVLALEPIANVGKGAVTLAGDGYTYRTKDGSRSANFEHTILLQKGGARIITA
ncbi:type I methionyl aminopeptidase [Candidatus Kaiserbacteria bacterium RIFCSPHIGHO2_12_FULL_56_13]|uniref:Methionine aminopeptidase n=1 Tax=Candidatus Kaiserbacteria bacterium RIFCSPHIGHO2_12_FULL_56_13 TaxID=1798505 RepID=A0A1F6EFN6_9BACT|nr:MAG: type I methionyl aminopeptidase [Candidatus Kaiserbacteria bacterium RIFCSPHIGHO2_12_FULL_56_13]